MKKALPLFLCVFAFLMNCERGSVQSSHLDNITVMQSSVTIGDPHICSDSANRLSIIFTVYEAPQLAQMMKEHYKHVGIAVEVVEHQDRAAYSEMVREKNISANIQ